MTAPSATARQTPAGIKLDDGHQTLITFEADPDIELWEKSVTPPGIDGGDGVDTTTMHNTTYRTMSPRSLFTLTPMTTTMAYDPVFYTRALDLINVETTVTITFPDGSTLSFYGFLKSFEPGELAEGAQPTASVSIVPTNQDPTTGEEEAPVLVNVPGT